MSLLKEIAHRVRDFVIGPVLKQIRSTEDDANYLAGAAAQLQLKVTYRTLAQSGQTLPRFAEVGFKVFSQSDEDGKLLYIFSVIGRTNNRSAEICAGDGKECNTANLIVNHGWSGLLVDGNETLVKEGQAFYSRNRYTHIWPPTFIHAWVTRNNINDLLKDNGFEGPIDLLSLDIDGMDYWIWEAITEIDPRVVVVEYNDILGPNSTLTVPYKDDFVAMDYAQPSGEFDYFGASLAAFVKLAHKKGCRLVGCNQLGYNAFFAKNPIGKNEIPEIAISDCFRHPKVDSDIRKRFPKVKDMPWIEV